MHNPRGKVALVANIDFVKIKEIATGGAGVNALVPLGFILSGVIPRKRENEVEGPRRKSSAVAGRATGSFDSAQDDAVSGTS